MSTIAVPSTCTCGSIGRTDLRQCPEHFKLWSGDKRLTSVGRVIRDLLPKPDVPADVLENARDRGEQTDRLFAAYVRGESRKFTAMRSDSIALFQKLRTWYDKRKVIKAETQVVLGGADFGGVVDFRFDDTLLDLKCTYDVLPAHELQIGGYLDIEAEMSGAEPLPGAILWVTERYKEPRVVPVDPGVIIEWRALRDAWSVIQRRTK